jgi:hypothetical protein
MSSNSHKKSTPQDKDKFLWAVAGGGVVGGAVITGFGSAILRGDLLIPEAIGTSIATIGASPLGTIVGGSISIAGTRYFNLKQRQETEKAQAYRTLKSIGEMPADIKNINPFILDSLKTNGSRVHPDE